MRVKMLTFDAGPKGVRRPGDIVVLPDAEARELIAARAAMQCDERGNPIPAEQRPQPRRERAVAPPRENAAADKRRERPADHGAKEKKAGGQSPPNN